MLKMIAGAEINSPEKLSQAYMISENKITANADAENIQKVMENFMDLNRDVPLFLFIEAPTNLKDEKDPDVVLHSDVYYLDGIFSDDLKKLLQPFYNILVNDGLSAFGIGNPYGEEIGKYKYNVMVLYSNEPDKYRQIFESEGIAETKNLITAWETFTQKTPGESALYFDRGKNIYDIIDALLSKTPLYKAEQRER